jgi:hypothetical protein
MAKKKKLSLAQRHKQQQKKSRRRSARVQTRPQPSHRRMGDDYLAPMSGPPGVSINLVMEDARPLLGGFGPRGPSQADSVRLMEMIWDTAELADEPEFAQIEIPPVVIMATFASAVQKLNLTPEAVDNASDPEMMEQSAELLDAVVDRLWSDEFSKEIFHALDQLRLRLRRERRPELPLVAVMQLFMTSEEGNDAVQSYGVVQEVVRRNMVSAFEKLTLADLVDEDDFDEEASTPLEIYEHWGRSSKIKALEAAAEQDEKLFSFLQRQGDEIGGQGEKALFTGKLNLGLFSVEEVDHALTLYQAAYDELAEAREEEGDEAEASTTIETIQAVLPQWQAYLRALFTPARLEQVRARMDEVVNDPAYGKDPLAPFLMMLRRNFAEESDLAYHERILHFILIGEVFQALGIEDDTEDE